MRAKNKMREPSEPVAEQQRQRPEIYTVDVSVLSEAGRAEVLAQVAAHRAEVKAYVRKMRDMSGRKVRPNTLDVEVSVPTGSGVEGDRRTFRVPDYLR